MRKRNVAGNVIAKLVKLLRMNKLKVINTFRNKINKNESNNNTKNKNKETEIYENNNNKSGYENT